MKNDVELEVRPRPLSAGLWTLFSWLRRDDRSDSNDSVSSAGSDGTVASFAFLKPAHYESATTPFVIPPPGPPTDSYKKRVHDRNLRRQYDRDVTLHRKYGLYKSGEAACGYDAFSLPPVRRLNCDSGARWDRDRRATSECFQRRLAHVPGKRRAPLPPIPTVSTVPPTSLTRRSTRKRRAPQPPVKLIEKNKENIKDEEVKTIVTQMNTHAIQEKQNLRTNNVSMGCKSEKYSKREGCSKDTKARSEKSFLKQIFDGKKRNSGIDITSVKLLPSISELDKQAAEIIENCKLNPTEQNNNVKDLILEKVESHRSCQIETWICVGCLRKYNSSVKDCLDCLQKQKVNSPDRRKLDLPSVSTGSNSYTQTENNLPSATKSSVAEDKQKLKEMLKEMKDSLPKRPKHNLNSKTELKPYVAPESHGTPYSKEMPTLRVGSTMQNENATSSKTEASMANVTSRPALKPTTTATQNQSPTELLLTPPVSVEPTFRKYLNSNVNIINTLQEKLVTNRTAKLEMSEQYQDKKDLHTPLKISSLLNPVYIPKNREIKITQTPNIVQTEKKTENQKIINDNNKRVSQTINNLTNTSNASDASTFQVNQLPVNNSKVEIKPKIVTEKTTETHSQNEHLAIVKKDVLAVKEHKASEHKQVVVPSTSSQEQNVLKDSIQDQHSRRRDLIRRLEQSIARGDELAAAESAAKLAQLRLSCSVLSFSSQILSEPSTSTANTNSGSGETKMNLTGDKMKVEPRSEMKLSLVKERLPLKVTVSNVKSGSSIIKPDVNALPSLNTKLVKGESPQNNQKTENKVTFDAKTKSPVTNDIMTTISVLVEDKEATRGPVQLRIRRDALMRDLRREAETSLGLATHLQRWIVGRVLCVNDSTPVISLAGTDFNSPFYLCVVESETKAGATSQPKTVHKSNNENINTENKGGNFYSELMQLEQQALVPNTDNFECGVCMEEYAPGLGAVLRECVHIFCKNCLIDVVRYCEEADILCPAMGCRGMLQEREIRALVTPQDYERWLARGLAAAESGTRNAFHCRTRDCKGWALCEPGVQRFPCPVCKHINCVPCQAIHDGATCVQHRARLQAAADKNTSETDEGTRTLLNSLIAKGEALECPECSAIITKKWGCDWVKCSACKTEICWVTRGRRWGPGGKGDTSGGCRCGIDGKRCHPSCGYCH